MSTVFLKKGIDKKKDGYIYPHPSQTNVGNCAAYAGAACLYAFGLDHQPALIPAAPGAQTDEGKFQYQISKMIEKLTDLIYGKNKNTVAEGYRQYINSVGLNCKFDVTEVPTVECFSYVLFGTSLYRSNMDYIISQMRQCQDLILSLKWTENGEVKRHAVGLVGIDEFNHKLILNNPWGGSVHVNPDDAGKKLEKGETTDTFKPYKYHVDHPDDTSDKKDVHIDFEGHDATVYNVVMICPAEPHAVAIGGAARSLAAPAQAGPALAAGSTRRYDYVLTNRTEYPVNGLAVQLAGLEPRDVLALHAPAGWNAALWFRSNEAGFDCPPPERMAAEPEPDFAGVIWRRGQGGLAKDASAEGFGVALRIPAAGCGEREGEAAWRDDPMGHGIALAESPGGSFAWHVNALVPARREAPVAPPVG